MAELDTCLVVSAAAWSAMSDRTPPVGLDPLRVQAALPDRRRGCRGHHGPPV